MQTSFRMTKRCFSPEIRIRRRTQSVHNFHLSHCLSAFGFILPLMNLD